LKLEIKKKLCSRSGRVKCVDIHPEYPWILAAMYSGNVTIYDYEK
jgi:coatomer subunit beta'